MTEKNQLPPSSDNEETSPLRPKRERVSFLSGLRTNFLAGIVVAAPIAITVYLLYLFITGPMASLDGFVQKVLPQIKPLNMDAYIPGLGVLVAILALIVLGALAKNFIGRSFIRVGERIVDGMPGVRSLYGFLKNVFEMALQQKERSFKEVALIEYPREGVWALSFVAMPTKGEVAHRLNEGDEEMISIFLPTTPNPTSGFLLFVPRSQVKILDMTVEEGAKLIFSAGLVTPNYDPAAIVEKMEREAALLREKADALRGTEKQIDDERKGLLEKLTLGGKKGKGK
ncbi:MAG: DUF502 domain-containing protein [Parvularculaceae bacterium]